MTNSMSGSTTVKLCMGNQALAFGALKAGVNVVSGYPGTPSSEILETIAAQARAGDLAGLHVEWSTNEKAALEVGAGAAFAGARALVTMKQVGLNVASDALMSLPYLGVKGGLVLIVADDPGPISSQTEQDTRQYAAFAKVPVLDPSTPEEAFAMVQEAFELSERHQTPVIVRPTTRICHGTAPLDVSLVYTPHAIGGFERGSRWVVFPRRAFEGHGEILERLPRIAAEFSADPYSGFNALEDSSASAPAHLGIAAGGISYAYLRDALRQLSGLGPLRLLKVGTPFPFPEAQARAFLEGLSEVLVLEELEPVIERELLQLAGKHHLPARILGKLTGHSTLAGENSVTSIAEQVSAFCAVPASSGVFEPVEIEVESVPAAGATAPAATPSASSASSASPVSPTAPPAPSASPEPPALPPRPPVLCAGCPHRASFFAVKRALRGRKAIFSGDIGCYTLGNALPLDMVDSCVCMGAGFTVPQGMDWAEPDLVHLGFVGDSTFFASGLTGAANAAYNRSRVTLCVLDNSTTAMTGSQPHPGTGIRAGFSAETAQQDAQRALRIPSILSALGIAHVREIDPFDLQTAIEEVRAAVDFDGTSALVFKAPCITVAPPKPQPTICADTCTNCKICIRSIGCPALVVRNELVTIDQTLCYGCKLCVGLCPTGAILPTPANDRSTGDATAL
jgi:indolepyruvate ferredoxin oxidoreductase alpha subunit